MKKIFKLFLCMLMLLSFTNIARALGDEEEESEFVDVEDVVENFTKTNFFEAEALKGNELTDIEVEYDEEHYRINIIYDDEIIMSFEDFEGYIKFVGLGHTPDIFCEKSNEGEEVDPDVAKNEMHLFYIQNMLYAVLDTMGYSEYDVDFGNETPYMYDDFYDDYGLLLSFGPKYVETVSENEKSNEGEEEIAMFVDTAKISLSKEQIGALVDEYGVAREDFLASATGVKTPELSVAKKNATIVVNWEEDAKASKFIVYRSEKKAGKYTKVATVTTNKYTDKKVKYGKTYYYKVKAIGEGSSETSEVVGLKMVPAKVKNVKLSAIKGNSIKVSYTKENETGYVIERSTNGKKWTTAKTITKAATVSFNDTKLKANTKYYYRVKAYKTVSGKKYFGAYSDVVSATTAPDKTKFSVKANTIDSLKVAITAVKGATNYEIYRTDSKNGKYEKVATVSETTYVDGELAYGKTYYYKVRACNAEEVCGAFGTVASLKVALKKAKLALETGKTIPMTLKVSNINDAEGYEVHRSTDNKKFTKIDTVEGTSAYVDKTAKKNKTYYYKVRSYTTIDDKRVYGAFSDVKSLKNLCAYKAPVEEPTPVVAQSVLEFVGVYKKESTIISIYSISEELNSVELSEGNMGLSYNFVYTDGTLLNTEEDEEMTIQRLSNNGILITGMGTIQDGVYSRLREYTTESYFADHYGSTEYMNSLYNGVFTNEQDEVLYLFQGDEEGFYLTGTVNGNEHIFEFVFFSEESDYEISAEEDGSLTLVHYVDGEVDYEKDFTRTGNLTVDDVIRNFYSYACLEEESFDL